MAIGTGQMKRLMKEMNDLKEYENISKLELVYPCKDDKLVNGKNKEYVSNKLPYFRIKIDNNELIVAFKDDYPFKPPVLLINNIRSYFCYKISESKSNIFAQTALIEMKRKYGHMCLCCESMICPGSGSWSPAHRIQHVLNEYKRNKEIKKYLNSYCALLQLNACMDYMLPTEMIEKIRDYL